MRTLAARNRSPQLIGSALLAVTLAVAAATAPGIAQADTPRAATRLVIKPKPPQPIKDVFVRTKPHVNVGAPHPGLKRLKSRPGHPTGPGNLTAPLPQLADWYCGEGSGPGGYAECTQDLIDSCSGTYKPPGTNGPEQTWGMCHESSGG